MLKLYSSGKNGVNPLEFLLICHKMLNTKRRCSWLELASIAFTSLPYDKLLNKAPDLEETKNFS